MYKYQKVYHHLKEKILNETYPPESQLPSEMGIASEYSVDRSTVRRALKYLSDEGLIEKRAGKEATVCGKTHKSITAPNETNKIGYLLPLGYKINEIFYSNLFYAIEKSFQAKGYTLIYSSLENSLLKILQTLELDGVILVSNYDKTYITDAIKAKVPCVLVNSLNPLIPSILSDNEQGAYLAGKHLIEKGHRNILVLSGVSSAITNQMRLAGFRRALSESGITLKDENIILAESWEIEDGAKSLRKHLTTQTSNATAIFGLNDRLAFGAMQTLHQMGLSVPDDFSVIGYDNLNNMTLSVIKMTTIETHIEMIAEAAVNQLLWQLSGGNCHPLKILAPVELVEGETVKQL